MKNKKSEQMQGLLLIDKPIGKTSFSLVATLRKLLGVKTIGHTGTLDPQASGVMVLLIGREFTRLSERLLSQDKQYIATVRLGQTTDTYDGEGVVVSESSYRPEQAEVERELSHFQGQVQQTPPMFSAKKQNGKKLYELARKGQVVDRPPVQIQLNTQLIHYEYPFVKLKIDCSKGTYIRSIADDLGRLLYCGAYLSGLQRTQTGAFRIEDCVDGALLADQPLGELIKQHTRLAQERGVL